MDVKTTWERLRAADAARPSFPAEHWWVAGAGLGLLLYAGSRRSGIARSLLRTLATVLLARAASGRDGLRGAVR